MGGTKIAGGVVAEDGTVLQRAEVATCADQGREFVLDQLRILIMMLAQNHPVDGIGIGVPGLYRGTVVVDLPNVPALNGVDLERELHLGAVVVLENDARCFTLAEWKYGAAKGRHSMVGVILGTGIGGGIIIDDELWHGARGSAGEIGHQIADFSHVLQDFSSTRCDWESLLSGPSIVKRHHDRGGMEDNPAKIWSSDSPLAVQTRDETTRLLAVFIVNLQSSLDPDVIVLGGGVSNLPLVNPVNALLTQSGGRPNVMQNALGKDAGIIGAVVALNK